MKFKLLLGALFLSFSLSAQVKPGIEVLRERGFDYLKGKRVSSDEQIAYVKELTEKFPFVFIEDMFDENDYHK